MHDTGMSGGQQIHLATDSNGNLIITTENVDSNGKAYRESHSFNSGVNILNEFEFFIAMLSFLKKVNYAIPKRKDLEKLIKWMFQVNFLKWLQGLSI